MALEINNATTNLHTPVPSQPQSTSAATDESSPLHAPTTLESGGVGSSSSVPPSKMDGETVTSEQSEAEQGVKGMVQQWIQSAAENRSEFSHAMQSVFGDQIDPNSIDTLRNHLTGDDANWMPAVHVVRDTSTTEVTYSNGILEVPAAMMANTGQAASAVAAAMAPALAEIAGLDPSVAAHADRRLLSDIVDPATHTDLAIYLRQPVASEQKPHEVLSAIGLEYGSASMPHGHVSTENIQEDYIAGWLGTGPEVGEMDDGGVANLLQGGWQASVAEAAQRNGGLGNQQDGYLAFSKKYGFVRLRNPRLAPEQNRRLAEMSLMMGVPVEKIPSRTADSALKQENVNHWVNEIIGRYDKEWSDFKADPTDGMSVSDGKKRYIMKVDKESGQVISYDFKKSGGVRGWVQKQMKYIGPVLDVASVAVNIIPGIGQAASVAIAMGVQALKTATSVIATGKLKATQVAGFLASAIPGLGKLTGMGAMSATQTAALNGSLQAAGSYIDTGKFDAAGLAAAVGPSIFNGLPGGPMIDRAVQNGAVLAAGAIQTGKLDAKAALGVLDSLVGYARQNNPATTTNAGTAGNQTVAAQAEVSFADSIRESVADALGIGLDTAKAVESVTSRVVSAIARGELTGRDVANALLPLAGLITDDKETQAYLKQTVGIVAAAVDDGTVEAKDVARLVLPLLFGEESKREASVAAAA